MDDTNPPKTKKAKKKSSCAVGCHISNGFHAVTHVGSTAVHKAGDAVKSAHGAVHGLSTELKKVGNVAVHKLKKCGVGVLTTGGASLGANVTVNVIRAASGKYLASFYGGSYGLLAVSAWGN